MTSVESVLPDDRTENFSTTKVSDSTEKSELHNDPLSNHLGDSENKSSNNRETLMVADNKDINQSKSISDGTDPNTESVSDKALPNIANSSDNAEPSSPDLLDKDGISKLSLGGLSKKCLRVKFPEDSGVVSGYMDPPTPWHDASACSTEELVAAYVASCGRLGIKPLQNLLSQLKAITNFNDRNETLMLKGEPLDCRHCDALEEVFRRVQFRMVDLEATKLDEESAVMMFDLLEYYESCVKLNISQNKNLNARGWQACSRMIRKTPCLDQLELRGCNLTDQVVPFLARSLRLGSPVTILHLEATMLSGRPLMILVTSLKMNETLKELYLADNKLIPSDGVQLGSLLKFNRSLVLLDLRNNHLQDVGMGHICDGLWEQTTGVGLVTFVVWNNQLTYQSMISLTKALKNTKSLETINVGHNSLTTEGIHRLKDGLLANKSLMRLGLQSCRINCEGAVALAEFIAESTRLVRLDLRENDIKTAGLMALALSLKVSRSVTRIDLDKDPKKESGVKDYADQQKRLLSDIYSLMSRNHGLARERDELLESSDSQLSSQIPAQLNKQSSLSVEPNEPGSYTEDQSSEPAVPDPSSQTVEPLNLQQHSHDVHKVLEQSDTKEQEQDTEGEKSSAGSEEKSENAGEKGEENLDEAEVQRRHRMNLSLAFSSRSETLESPAFIRDSEIKRDSPHDSIHSVPVSSAPASDLPKQKIPVDLPQSPVLSSHGHAQLVPLFEDALSPLDDRRGVADISNISLCVVDDPTSRVRGEEELFGGGVVKKLDLMDSDATATLLLSPDLTAVSAVTLLSGTAANAALSPDLTAVSAVTLLSGTAADDTQQLHLVAVEGEKVEASSEVLSTSNDNYNSDNENSNNDNDNMNDNNENENNDVRIGEILCEDVIEGVREEKSCDSIDVEDSDRVTEPLAAVAVASDSNTGLDNVLDNELKNVENASDDSLHGDEHTKHSEAEVEGNTEEVTPTDVTKEDDEETSDS